MPAVSPDDSSAIYQTASSGLLRLRNSYSAFKSIGKCPNMSLFPGSSRHSRSRSTSRTRVEEEDDSHDEYVMSGALPTDASSIRSSSPNMAAMAANPHNTPPGGVMGVQYSEPMVPTYTPYPQWGAGAGANIQPARTATTGYNAPTGTTFQYAQPPAAIRYTSKPVIPSPPPIMHTSEPADEKKKKKKKDRDVPAMPVQPFSTPSYTTMTIEPGDKPSKKKKKDKDIAMPYPTGGAFGGAIPPPPPILPGTSPFQNVPLPPPPPIMPGSSPFNNIPLPPPPPMPITASSPYPISTPGAFPIDARDEYPVPSGRVHTDGARIMDIEPRGASPPKKSKSHRLSTSGLRPDMRAPSPMGGARDRMSRLSVSGDRPDISGIIPPASPLLEAYRGTYQTMPGMPSPMIHARYDDFDDYDLDQLEPLSPRHSRERVERVERTERVERVKVNVGKSRTLSIAKSNGRSSSRNRSVSRQRSPKRKSVSMYEAEQDASIIATELTRSKPDFRVLTDILPGLSHDQIIELHTAYKHVAKYQGRGINIAKHIKLKVPGHLRTIAYVTALGRWESEGYWANYWYQSAVSKRELLIESLMGRSNFEMQMIKADFKDKRYGDSLVKCMDKELRVDKFRTAVMLALEGRRQEENETFPREYVQKDVDSWARALRGRSGGETAMLEICVNRSDRHLKECLRQFERTEGGNFAKLALQRSENLVGEVIAHILNGIINRPARDAMLLHHALLDLKPRSKDRRSSGSSGGNSNGGSPRSSFNKLNPFSAESREGREREREKQKERAADREDRKDRHELLISRLIRYHWDRTHLRRVKDEYRDKYGAYVEDDVADWLKPGEFQEFCLEMLHAG